MEPAKTKADLWASWIEATLIRDIQAPDRPDPIPFLSEVNDELVTTDALDSYRYGRGSGDFLYILYLADEPVENAGDITPAYIGESDKIGSRLYQHYKRMATTSPPDLWEDDGSWGSYSKYDHLAAIREQMDGQLYAWILDVDTLDRCPYGVETYRQELEAKLVGLVHSHPHFRRTFANREFVPNRILHEMGKAGADWLSTAAILSGTADRSPRNADITTITSKPELWQHWLDNCVYPDFAAPDTADPIPLFATNDQLQVELTERDRLERSAAIDERIRREGRKCADSGGVIGDEYEGLLYMMYQLAESPGVDQPAIVPRYIGKAEVYGKKRKLSSNFLEIANDRAATRSFARWGDGNYWHVGELSMAIFEGDTRKAAWASELFRQRTHSLKEQVYLWVRAWSQNELVGPYGYDAYLAEVEPQLIGLAQAAHPNFLLNKQGVPSDAPIRTAEFSFDAASL